MRILHDDEICLLQWTSSLNDRSKLKGQCSDVKKRMWSPTVSVKTKFSCYCSFKHVKMGPRWVKFIKRWNSHGIFPFKFMSLICAVTFFAHKKHCCFNCKIFAMCKYVLTSSLWWCCATPRLSRQKLTFSPSSSLTFSNAFLHG